MGNYAADQESLDYFKHFSDRFRFVLVVDFAALLFVFNQGVQTSFAPTAGASFLISLGMFVASIALAFVGYSATNGVSARLLRYRAMKETWTFPMGWRDSAIRWVHWLAAFLMSTGLVGLVIHYFFQWFLKNQNALGS